MIPRSIRHPVGRRAILQRLARLTPQHERHWGRMDAAALLPHLAAAIRMALGELRSSDTPPHPVVATLKRCLAIYVLPWPKGRIKAPSGAFDTPSAGWEEDRRIVESLIARFAETPPDQLGATHPLFGRMNLRDWDVLEYRHLDHHLRQFGV